jgi:dimethyladenosine transferase 2, mitochondrial
MTFRTSSVLFQLLFEYEIIDKFNEKDFIPWFLREKTSDRKIRKELLSIDKDLLYFVKIVPRQNLLKFCPIENLTALWFFITQNFTKKTNRVIPQLE